MLFIAQIMGLKVFSVLLDITNIDFYPFLQANAMTILNLHAHQGKDGAFQKTLHKMEMKIAQMVQMNTVGFQSVSPSFIYS